ncbi:MAG: helix-turn-helix domain-containing protein [bacterium]
MEDTYKVIVVEDEERILNNIIKKIHQANMGFKVIGKAQNGKQALSLVDELGPDVVFTDIKMPIMDGLELLENLYFNYPYIKTVIISGYAEFEYAQKAILYNVKNYLLKPIEMEELIKTLNGLKISIDTERKIIREKFSASEDLQNPKDIVYIIREYIKEHYTEEINFNFIAESFHYSSSYLSRVFTQYIGINPSRYLIDLRINRAKYLLKNYKELSIKQISEAIGYPDQSYFSRLFKRITGKTPIEYREEIL